MNPFLQSIIADAAHTARQSCLNIYVIESPVYADEHAGHNYVYGDRESCTILFPKADWMQPKDWKIIGVASPDGNFFAATIETALEQLAETIHNNRKS